MLWSNSLTNHLPDFRARLPNKRLELAPPVVVELHL